MRIKSIAKHFKKWIVFIFAKTCDIAIFAFPFGDLIFFT